MRTLIIAIGFLTISSTILTAQDLPIDTPTGKIIFTEVIFVDDSAATKDQLFSRAREWFARTFRSSQNVLQVNDKELAKLIAQTNFSIKPGKYLTESRVDFTLSIYIKDGRYKYEVTDFDHISNKAGYSGGALEDEKPDCGTFSMVNKGWIDVKEQTKSKVEALIAELKRSMKKEVGTENEDW